MKILILLLILVALVFPLSVKAGERSRLQHYPIITTYEGNIIGTVHVTQDGDLMRMDYDFGEPAECKLESISTRVNSSGRTYIHWVDNESGNTISDGEGTYIAPRDAVLVFDDSEFSSSLDFDCDGRNTPAFVETNLMRQTSGDIYTYTPQSNQNYQYQYENRTYSTRSNRSGSQYWYEGKTSGDGYELQYDEERDYWYLEDMNSRNRRSNQRTRASNWYEGRNSGDGYELQYNDDKGWWYFADKK